MTLERQHEGRHEFVGREVGGVIEIVQNPEGWGINQIDYRIDPDIYLSGNPNRLSSTPENLRAGLEAAWQRTKEIREPAGDFDSPKVTTRSIDEAGSTHFHVEAGLTDYFTLWGIPGASPEIHQRAITEITKNHETELPNGISMHNILLTSDGNVVLLVRSRNQGFSAGRVSLSFEEQMDPHTDIVPHNTAYRGYWEELGLFIPKENIKLLGVAAEKGSAYTAWCFIATTNKSIDDVRASWKSARDYSEASALFVVPIEELDQWTGNEISPDIWKPKDIESKINPEAVLQPHPTVLWRANLLKKSMGWY